MKQKLLMLILLSTCFLFPQKALAAEQQDVARHYDITKDGGTFVADANGNYHYVIGDATIKNAFLFDGTYTYYLQNDGTPMKDRLTYHPDGEHVIYFDSDGHEVFDHTAHITKSISGEKVDDDYYFGTYGFMFQDQIAFEYGIPRYYNACGVLQKNGEFYFADGNLGVADEEGFLQSDGFGYDAFGQKVFYHWNGKIARGLFTDGEYYYQMDEKDGHLLGTFPVENVVSDSIPADSAKIGPQTYDMRLVGENAFTGQISNWYSSQGVASYMTEKYGDQYWQLDIYKDAAGNVVDSETKLPGKYATIRGITIGSTREQVYAAYGRPEKFGYTENGTVIGYNDENITNHNSDWYMVSCCISPYAVDWLEQAVGYEYSGIRFTYDENDVVVKISYMKVPMNNTLGEYWYWIINDPDHPFDHVSYRDVQPETPAPAGHMVTLDASQSVYAIPGSTYQWYAAGGFAGTFDKLEGETTSQYQFVAVGGPLVYKCSITHLDGKHYDVMFPVNR